MFHGGFRNIKWEYWHLGACIPICTSRLIIIFFSFLHKMRPVGALANDSKWFKCVVGPKMLARKLLSKGQRKRGSEFWGSARFFGIFLRFLCFSVYFPGFTARIVPLRLFYLFTKLLLQLMTLPAPSLQLSWLLFNAFSFIIQIDVSPGCFSGLFQLAAGVAMG